MQILSNRHPHHFKTNVVKIGDITIAIVLLIGLIILGYGYLQHFKVAFYVGLIVIIAGVLNGIVQIIISKEERL